MSLAGADALDGVQGADGRERAAPAVAGLPRWLSPFFGRSELVAQVAARLADPAVQLLTLTGPGGVGKSRLAARAAEGAAHSFPDGTHFIPLAPVVDAALVLPMIGRAVGVPEGAEGPAIERLARTLAGRRTLLVLDNLEQVLEVGPALARLLRDVPGVTLLATSRAPLRVEGEHELPIPPLSLPVRGAAPSASPPSEAVGFFLERVRAVRPEMELTAANTAAIDEIVRRLDGLPLALELAATRAKVLSPEGLLAQMGRQLQVLTGGPRDRLARQRTMRDTIAWSYGLLEADLQALFRRLAVFRGGFSLEDAEAVLAGSSVAAPADGLDILDGVAALVDHSLLVTGGDGDPDRFRMLETIREFGLEQLTAAGESAAVHGRFGAHWAALARASWAHTAELEALSRALAPLQRNADNVRAALDWLEANDLHAAADLADALIWFWYLHGDYGEMLRRVRRLLERAPEIPSPLRARLHIQAGWAGHFQDETEAGRRDLELGLAMAREHGDAWAVGFAALGLGIIDEDTEAYERAQEVLTEAVERLTDAGDDASLAAARYHLGVVAFGRGDLDTADAELRWVLGDRYAAAIHAGWALHLRGLIAHLRGDAATALRDEQEMLGRYWEARHPSGVCEGLAAVAVVAAGAGHPLAARLWSAAEGLAERRGYEFHPPERGVYEAAVARLRASLGEAAYLAEAAAGRELEEEAAVEAALALEMRVPEAPRSGPLASLSPRELEVLRLVARGWTNERIAEELFLSPRTINTHLTSVFRKLDVENRTEAVRVLTAAGGA